MRHVLCLLTLLALNAPGAAAVTFIHGGNVGFFNTQFTNAATAAGYLKIDTETFEEGLIPGGTGIMLDDPLTSGVPNLDGEGRGFPEGLSVPHLTVQSNPFGSMLNMLGAGVAFNQSKAAAPGGLESSLDIIFDADGRYAAGFTLLNPAGALMSVRAEVRVYDREDQLMGMVVGDSAERVVNFYGIISDEPIGRINVLGFNRFAEPLGKEIVDDIQIWIPEPSVAGLILAGGLCFLSARRRRVC